MTQETAIKTIVDHLEETGHYEGTDPGNPIDDAFEFASGFADCGGSYTVKQCGQAYLDDPADDVELAIETILVSSQYTGWSHRI